MSRMLRRKEVLARTGLSQTTMYELIEKGLFPRPVKITDNKGPLGPSAWPDDEIDAYNAARRAERDAALRDRAPAEAKV